MFQHRSLPYRPSIPKRLYNNEYDFVCDAAGGAASPEPQDGATLPEGDFYFVLRLYYRGSLVYRASIAQRLYNKYSVFKRLFM